jgi:hypothetical protein
MAGGYAIAGLGQPVQYFAAAAAQQAIASHHQGGVIFLCDPRTEEECLQRGLFGLPATQTPIVRAIVPEATLLFLFNVRHATSTSCVQRRRPHAALAPLLVCLDASRRQRSRRRP